MGTANLYPETTFDQNGLNPVEKRTDFNNPSHLQVTSSTTKLSNDKLNEQQFLYPSEMISSGRDVTGIYVEMELKNMISPVIEQVNKKGGLIAAVQRTIIINLILAFMFPVMYRPVSFV